VGFNLALVLKNIASRDRETVYYGPSRNERGPFYGGTEQTLDKLRIASSLILENFLADLDPADVNSFRRRYEIR
jgi:hypothetical protein